MNFDYITNIAGCIPSATQMMGGNLSLIPYSHIPVAVLSLLIAIFVLKNNYKLKSARILAFLAILFSLWVIFSMITWISSSSVLIMFFWSLFGIIDSLIFLTSFYLVFSFLNKNNLKLIYKVLLSILVLPIFLLTPTVYNLSSFNYSGCYANDNLFFNYIFIVKAILASILLITIIYRLIQIKDHVEKRQVALMSLGVSFFLLSFFLFGYLADTFEKYSLEVYGVFAMTFLMALIAFLIVKFKAFNIKLIGAQALVWALVILIGSQFTYYNQMPLYTLIITSVTLILSTVMGLMIVRSVKKEIALREELQISNKNQESLIHFVSHQLKGFFTKSKMIFAGIMEEDFGQTSETLKSVAKEGLSSDNNAVTMIQEILGASNYKKGTIAYTMKEVNFTEIVKEVCDSFTKEVADRGLDLETNISDEILNVLVDRTQITQVIRNIIDNSIKYTPTGSINISVKKSFVGNKEKAVFEISDTGIGLSAKDKSMLFTDGGKGEDSLKYNTNSTGYGLYIVKKIVENHGGKIWAESAGRGKGSQFYVELDLVR